MNPEAARAEFNLRYYRWALQDFKREIDQGFPWLKGFKTGSPAEVLKLLTARNRDEQMTMANALVKRFHKDAVEAAGDDMTGAEIAAKDTSTACLKLIRWRLPHCGKRQRENAACMPIGLGS